jgi:hypothetical protein
MTQLFWQVGEFPVAGAISRPACTDFRLPVSGPGHRWEITLIPGNQVSEPRSMSPDGTLYQDVMSGSKKRANLERLIADCQPALCGFGPSTA